METQTPSPPPSPASPLSTPPTPMPKIEKKIEDLNISPLKTGDKQEMNEKLQKLQQSVDLLNSSNKQMAEMIKSKLVTSMMDLEKKTETISQQMSKIDNVERLLTTMVKIEETKSVNNPVNLAGKSKHHTKKKHHKKHHKKQSKKRKRSRKRRRSRKEKKGTRKRRRKVTRDVALGKPEDKENYDDIPANQEQAEQEGYLVGTKQNTKGNTGQ